MGWKGFTAGLNLDRGIYTIAAIYKHMQNTHVRAYTHKIEQLQL